MVDFGGGGSFGFLGFSQSEPKSVRQAIRFADPDEKEAERTAQASGANIEILTAKRGFVDYQRCARN